MGAALLCGCGDGNGGVDQGLPTSTPTPTPCASRFCDNGDGTVTDNQTGLMWEKKSDDGTIHDKDNTYTWSTGTPWSPNGTAFTTFLVTLNTPPCFAGHCDWRLPSEEGQDPPYTGPKELESILAAPSPCIRFLNPCVPPAFNTGCTPECEVTGCSCTQPWLYWSASSMHSFPNAVWYVDFTDGFVYGYFKEFSGFARAVRSGV